ncbi:MAG: PEP-CTERM sorting domain-containing protein [Rhodoferax sp.]|uniref:PEP-CTERM sorting domain-containing protein n=1 Tax=Rhodoferax sp. TaxID=50421 RepID=UPI002727AAB0|nr:PEP-CTERM sorting domain-containing protein [Rhodoferax sp.]MDO8451028.1 PEP-CTERM sorting domain-containing protein [Rhodoferax sp.]
MITNRLLAALGIGMLVASSAGVAFATPFTPVLDEFWIVKGSAAAGSNEIFRDSFNNSVPPPSGPDGPTTYSLFGAGGITSEAAGKLTMTPSLGAPTVNTATYADVSTSGTRLLATNPANPNFLGQASSFEMHALYDMSNLPTVQGQSFGLHATDRATGIGNSGNNTYALFVGVNTLGDRVVALRFLDYTTNSSTVIGAVSIESLLPVADQVDLILSKALGSSDLSASYVLYDINDTIVGSGSLGANTPLTIYNGEDYIRAQFDSTDRVSVPEPATLTLFGIGLAGICFMRRRKMPEGVVAIRETGDLASGFRSLARSPSTQFPARTCRPRLAPACRPG